MHTTTNNSTNSKKESSSSKTRISPALRRTIEAQSILLFFRFSSTIATMAFSQGKLSEKIFLLISIPLGISSSLYYLHLNIRRTKATEISDNLCKARVYNIEKRAELKEYGEGCENVLSANIITIESKSSLEKTRVVVLFVIIEITSSVGHSIIPLLYKRDYIATPAYAALLFSNMILGTLLIWILNYDREKNAENAKNNTKLEKEREQLESLTTKLLKKLWEENKKLQEEKTKIEQSVISKQTETEAPEGVCKSLYQPATVLLAINTDINSSCTIGSSAPSGTHL